MLDDALIHEAGKRLQARSMPEPSVERARWMERRDRIAAWLSQQKPLRLTKVHTLVPLGVECTDGMCRL